MIHLRIITKSFIHLYIEKKKKEQGEMKGIKLKMLMFQFIEFMLYLTR